MAAHPEIRSQGVSVLLVEHDMKMVMGVGPARRADQGKKIAEGAQIEIQRDPG